MPVLEKLRRNSLTSKKHKHKHNNKDHQGRKSQSHAGHNHKSPMKWLMKPGNMTRAHKELVSRALQKCEDSHHKLNVVDIRNLLAQQGMKSLVIEGDAAFTWSKGSDNISYSKWMVDCGDSKANKHEHIFTVICVEFNERVEQMVCKDPGTMRKDQIAVISDVFKDCIHKEKVATNVIKDKLKEKGMKTIVVKDDGGFSLSRRDDMTWSVWKSTKYGKFSIVSTEWRPVDNNQITCKNPGNMSVNEKHVISLALKGCDELGKMGVSQVRNKLNELGMKSVVIKDRESFCYLSGTEALTWSEWECTKYGLFTVIKTAFEEKGNKHIKMTDSGNMNDVDKYTILESLEYCLSHQEMECEDIHKKLQSRGIEGIVMRNVTQGFAEQQGNDQIAWSKWEVEGHGSFTIMIMGQ